MFVSLALSRPLWRQLQRQEVPVLRFG